MYESDIKMTTIIIKTKGRTKLSKLLIDMAEELSKNDKSIEIISEDTPNSTTIKAIADARKGKTVKCDNFEDYIEKVK